MTKGAVLILGGRSDIGLATAHALAGAGHPVWLAARNAAGLEPERTDLALRHGVEVSLHEFDVLDTAAMPGFLDALPGLPAVVVSVVGLLGDQAKDEHDPAAAICVMRTNYEGPATILGLIAERMEARGSGAIVGVSSVAGLRGRATNYIYGSAKAGFTAYLSGLRNRLAIRGVHVVTVLPGFVDTRMTAGMDLPKKLTAAPKEVGAAVRRALEGQRDVVYVKPVWRLVMTVIRAIPERVFKKLRL